MTEKEFQAKLRTLPEEEPDKTDMQMLRNAADEDDGTALSRTEFERELGSRREYSGRLLVRIPKELHRTLSEEAKANGVSLNQYALYKLSR